MNVRSKKLTTIITLTIMIATVIIGLVTGLTMYLINKQSDVDSYVVDGDGNALDPGKVHKMPSNLIYTSPTPMSDESGSVVDELILKATIEPATAANKLVDWVVKWAESNEWSVDKSVEDYLTVERIYTNEVDYIIIPDIVKVVCHQAFGAKIKIIVTSLDNPDAKAECVVDFARQLADVNVISTNTLDEEQSFSVTDELKEFQLFNSWSGQDFIDFSLNAYKTTFEYLYSELPYTVDNPVLGNKFLISTDSDYSEAMSEQGVDVDLYMEPLVIDGYHASELSYGHIIAMLSGQSNYMHLPGREAIEIYNKMLIAFGRTQRTDFVIQTVSDMTYGNDCKTISIIHVSHKSRGLAVTGVTIDDSLVIDNSMVKGK